MGALRVNDLVVPSSDFTPLLRVKFASLMRANSLVLSKRLTCSLGNSEGKCTSRFDADSKLRLINPIQGRKAWVQPFVLLCRAGAIWVTDLVPLPRGV